MFQKTWKWAGEFRRSNKNIDCFWENVPSELKKLFDDAQFQLENKSYSVDEIAARFHHRLVFIHPFPKGNGRHARLMTDILLYQQGEKRFTWGRKNLTANNQVRKTYIHALRQADKGDYSALFQFVRT